ncbi:Coenzyme Q (ubiquinone) biosynthesis protein Coq4, putative [Talaromyces stipitatus ATCC 10500]|uniref:Ubiquinone biosynthesis protein coq4, mitochondrial n=1 Tax=Talaromyces stipitatus (strain ATCC 10500 / CBS 375.48 / QM 6759 / NRRL 1006) TaxID=441959 RepID=COQ4_TALSN|nr:Coenzyme Q (ubiquinone) biosynthesis protein Coq4, putative [Talaromyces stipitatus ATCC 10500]B8MLN6.1 RecName: Full=Ubiquinone biosynthesis protein coq4, mitochondrial; AltName: Full=Coenzyme Q biosynthesis protein 4 [Talaromyces stipitatus ATCC 10500]EED13899.1 Coenzyme Q (ubiquinone) biosynthesis protein Coq4, putative [Talaromyces stipitatus ATCC 10500]
MPPTPRTALLTVSNRCLQCHEIGLKYSFRSFSALNRPPPSYPGHVPLTRIERGVLAIGSAFGSLLNPRRHDLIAALGEATATPYFIYRLRDAMLSSPTGRRILRDRPRLTSETLKLPYLRSLPENSVGRTYAKWLDREGVSPDTRDSVQYIDDEECAYVMQRYRECHDFYHAVTGLPTMVEGELALKAFEFLNTVIPMTGLSLAAAIRLKPAERERFFKLHLPWAVRSGLSSEELINVYWEEQLERNVDELRAELGIEAPPDLREIRRMMRQQEKRAKEQQMKASGL